MKPKFFSGDLGVLYLTNARKSGFQGQPEVINFTELSNRSDPYDVSFLITRSISN